MNTDTVKDALQDLIIRLQDAEKGYKEISHSTSNIALKKWLNRYASERHSMHQVLEGHVAARGGKAEIKTSILGDLHRIFIDIKLSATDDDFGPIVEEIKRGSDRLIADYHKIIEEVELPANLITTLHSQRMTIELEVQELLKLKEEFESVPA